jgi:polysaccharide pyruvyl transferase WcaK-like protein
VQLITFRDEKSKSLAQEIGITKPPIHVTADPVFLLNPPYGGILDPAAKEEGIEGDSLRVGISVRPWESQVDYPTLVAKAADMIVEKLGASVFIFPFQHSQDFHVCRQVQSKMKNPAHLVEKIYPVNVLMGLLGRMDMIIGMRLHSLIFSAAHGIPSLGICYDPKVSSVMELLDLPCVDVQSMTEDSILQPFLGLYKNMDRVHDDLIARTGKLKELAARNVELLKGLL